MLDAQSQSPAFARFHAAFAEGDVLGSLRKGLIGEGRPFDGPAGRQILTYADYTASGRALRQVEDFITEEVLPFYANSHTEASFCGGWVTRLRREARSTIAGLLGARDEHAVVFAGSGATAGINRIAALWQVGAGDRVLIGPQEHHSNILPWRESGAEVIELPEGDGVTIDLAALAHWLAQPVTGRVICAFSAASNVTGDIADVVTVTRMANQAKALILWDYAGGGPYLPISLHPGDGVIDGLVLSPHKCVGGPGASGVFAVRTASVRATRPTWAGGGTVRFVSPVGHDWSGAIEAREEAGTPNVIGDIRACLALMVKDMILRETSATELTDAAPRAEEILARHPRIQLLGQRGRHRLPIFAFRVRDGQGGYVHQQLVTRMLSDHYGIQARGGCACAGPYVHRLLGIDEAASARLRTAILGGQELEKPGFTRFNISALMTADKTAFILRSILDLADHAVDLAPGYTVDESRAIFTPI